MSLEGLFLQVAAATIAASLAGIAALLLALTRQVERLNATVSKLSSDFGKVQDNYVHQADFREVKDAFWAMHDQCLRNHAGDNR